jgi:hypothetical protein
MNSADWWKLPGPGRFINSVTDDLRDGRNVILSLPEHLAGGLARAIRDDLGDCLAWFTLTLDEEVGGDPAAIVDDRFVADSEPYAIRNASGLAAESWMAGRIIWIDGLSHDSWQIGKRFLADFQHACRSRPLLQRGRFCVALVGELALNPPTEDACLANHYWRGCVEPLDILIYVTRTVCRRGLSSLQHRLVVAVISSVAQWDPRVCDHFAGESLARILDPGPALKELAQIRGWTEVIDHETALAAWHSGMVDDIEERPMLHPAALAMNDPTREIAHRVWSAETSVLLPFIEEKRRGFLEKHGKCLKVPFCTAFGTITDMHDLEIGHIDYQLAASRPAIDGEVRGLVARLREIRNALSHLDPVPVGLLEDGKLDRG